MFQAGYGLDLMAGEALDDSLGLAATKLVLLKNDSIREASTTSISLIELCTKLLLCNNFNDSIKYLPFFSFKCCESVVSYIILLDVARKLSTFL